MEIKNILGLLAGGGTLATLAAAATTTSLSLSDDLKKIEVYFYDSGDNSNPKRLRFPLTNDLAPGDGFEVFEKASGGDSGGDGSWKKYSALDKTDEKNMWHILFGLANHYVHVQHKLNIIRQGVKDKISALSQETCKDVKCCCKDKKQQTCDCTKDKCCWACICCYAKKTTSQDCCCKNGDSCNWEDLNKSQKTFEHFLGNLDSGWNNQYLQPVQVHIKLPETSIDSDLKIDPSASSSGASTGSVTTTEQKSSRFYGTMVYGFVDYYSKPKKYQDALPKGQTSQYSTLEEGKDAYFANVPQSFTFKYKPKQTTGASATSTTTEIKDNIEDIYKKVKGAKETKEKIDEINKSSSSQEYKACCKDENDIIQCAVTRNYMFLENTALTNIQNKIKDLKNCCEGAKP